MDFPRFPDWLVYGAIVTAVVAGAMSRREHADAPAPPPAPPGSESVPLGPDSPFDPVSVIRTSTTPAVARGTAFSVAEGVWLSAKVNLEGCTDIALKVAEGRAVRALNASASTEPLIATLTTPGGPEGMWVETPGAVRPGQRGYIPGFPQYSPGEVSAALVGEDVLSDGLRAISDAVGVAWAETGRTEGLKGALPGLIGAPILNEQQHVVGIVTGFDPRRGRIVAATPEAVVGAIEMAGASRAIGTPGRLLSVQNYYRTADELRRNRQVAQILCLRGESDPG